MPKSREEVIAEIGRLNAAWLAAAEAKDLDGMMAIYAADAREMLPGMPALEGRDEIRSFYERLMRDLPRFSHAFSPLDAVVSESRDLVVMRGKYRFVADAEAASQVSTGKYVGVWRVVEDSWRLVMNISNDDGKAGSAEAVTKESTARC